MDLPCALSDPPQHISPGNSLLFDRGKKKAYQVSMSANRIMLITLRLKSSN